LYSESAFEPGKRKALYHHFSGNLREKTYKIILAGCGHSNQQETIEILQKERKILNPKLIAARNAFWDTSGIPGEYLHENKPS